MSAFPNRGHYPIPVLSGAAVAVIGSFIPILNYLNLVLFWFIVGGVLAVHALRRRAPSASRNEYGAVGALSGLFAGAILATGNTLVAGGLYAGLLSAAEGPEGPLVFGVIGLVVVMAVWAFALVVFPLGGLAGGSIGAKLWPPSHVASEEERDAEKILRAKVLRRILRVLAIVSAFCLPLLVLGVGALGYAARLQSQPSDEATVGGPRVVDLPIAVHQRTRFELPSSSGTYVVWVVADGVDDRALEGGFACSHDATIPEERWDGVIIYGANTFDDPSWNAVASSDSGGMMCVVELGAPDPLPPGARLVVTQHVRPSNALRNWLR